LSNESNITEQDLKEVTTIISEMAKGTANASAGIDAIVDDMGQLLIESGASEEAIDALIEQFKKLGTLTPEIE
jgi:ABC-type transporter Mla subunit MlaD